ncbi:NADH:flavin oxidoreductase/NADH oxidase [Dinghuibacter silviterrae]|uniref:2,4-dienoyl-CoA reductase-like NADH-dependent reductase (Old Yellow Enzyme family) n=1 Tax=Dinghuibacter silviterrae TaxID=1539049 RepID=A0A4V3GLI8_9BACT|nr:NADH:flavin oxidoreductase/NADH oxidase [Dinghuibacter silviterrae]TDW99722.1 2,4-dienoyl-CoA reductase-like NADH-dependent reductase (Old Yellow Enzyme family) [Dinghuibacter silviterrae]
MAHLFSPFRLRSVELKNRIVVSPMCEYSAVNGYTNDWHLVHLGSRAVGGAGAVIVEATAVNPQGRITPDDLGLWEEGQIEGLERITRFIAAQGCVPGIQLAHAGRKASRTSPWKGDRLLDPTEGGWTMVSASALSFRDGERLPVALDAQGIAKIKEDFVRGARFALAAGFKLLEVHAAHGYLFHQFLSPLSNQRTDDYGGSLDNRIRLLCEVVEAIRGVWPDTHPLWVRLSVTDWDPTGWTPEDSVYLSQRLRGLGVDLIDCSSGGILPHIRIPLGPGYQVPLAETVRRETGLPTAAVGLITGAAQAEGILEEGKADLILLARQMLRDPYFPLHAARELGVDIPWPSQYERAKPK